MKPIKICMLVHQDYFRDGRVRRYAEACAKEGIKVDILCVKSDYEPPSDLHENIRVYTVPFARGYKKSKVSYLIEYFLIMLFFNIWVSILYGKNHYHIIHVHNMPDFLVFSAWIPKLFGAKIILDIHDPSPEFFISKFDKGSEGLFLKLLMMQEKMSIGYSDAVITANDKFKTKLIERGVSADKITVVVNVPDINLFNREKTAHRQKKDQDKFILVYPGTIAPRYGLDVAIKSLPEIVKYIPDVLIRIIGAYNYHVDELKALASELDVSPYVDFPGVVSIEEVAGIISESDVGIYTAYQDLYMSIITPVKVLEFAYMGVPIISSRTPVLMDYFTEEGISFFSPGNSDEFAQCVIDLFSDQERRIAQVKFSDQHFVKQFTWKAEYDKYKNLLLNILKMA